MPAAVTHEAVQYSPHQTVPQPSSASYSSSTTPCLTSSDIIEWAVADILLSGVLDAQASGSIVPSSGPRSWIGGGADFAFTPDSMSEGEISSYHGSVSSFLGGMAVSSLSLQQSVKHEPDGRDELQPSHISEKKQGTKGAAYLAKMCHAQILDLKRVLASQTHTLT